MNFYLIFFIALIPIIFLIISLGILKIPGFKACPIALIITLMIAALALWPIVANILFGELQVEVAKSLGINPYWS
jgi:lactate permease